MLESRCLWQRERNRYILLIIDFVDIIIAAIINKLRKRKRMCNFFRIFVTGFFKVHFGWNPSIYFQHLAGRLTEEIHY